MCTRETTAKLIKPLGGSFVRRHTTGVAVAAGECVALKSDTYVDPCDCTSAADESIGVALQATAGSGEVIDIVVFGPVLCLSGATVGGTVFNTTTAGEYTQTDAGNVTAVGYAETATILFVQPEHLA